MNIELINITNVASQAETDYQEANTRLADARRAVRDLEDEVAGMTKNPTTNPDKLAKKVADLNARKLLLPALEEVTATAHRHMMTTREAIANYHRMLEAQRQRAVMLRGQIRQGENDIQQQSNLLQLVKDNTQRMRDELAGIEALLDGRA